MPAGIELIQEQSVTFSTTDVLLFTTSSRLLSSTCLFISICQFFVKLFFPLIITEKEAAALDQLVSKLQSQCPGRGATVGGVTINRFMGRHLPFLHHQDVLNSLFDTNEKGGAKQLKKVF